MKLASLLLLVALAHGQHQGDFDNGPFGGGQGGQGGGHDSNVEGLGEDLDALAHGQQQGDFNNRPVGGGQGGHDNNVEGLGEWETDHEGMAAFSPSVSESAGGMELLDEVPPPDSDSDEDEDDHVEQVDLPHCPYSLVSFSCKPGTGPSYVNT